MCWLCWLGCFISTSCSFRRALSGVCPPNPTRGGLHLLLSCFICRRLGAGVYYICFLSCFIFQSLGARMAPGTRVYYICFLSCFSFHELGGQYGSMRAPAGRPGGCKMLLFHLFYRVFTFSMHPARWLIRFAHGANSEAQLRFSRPRGFHFSGVFSNENGISEGRRFVAHAREAMPMISLFPVSPRFPERKCGF